MMTENGCSTTKKGEQYEKYTHRGKTYFQYDYRFDNGELFSCVKPTLEECRNARDKWLKEHQ